MEKTNYTVKAICNKETYPFLLNIHYAKRIPSISYSFGLYKKDDLVGVITYGTPPSPNLKNALKKQYKKETVLELNRLCLRDNIKNEASFLISKSLKLLPKDAIIVSFADTSQGHTGTVYKAANFTYLGLSAKRKDWKIKGQEHLHGMSIADKFRGVPNRSKLLRETFGDNFYSEERSRKHKYVYIT